MDLMHIGIILVAWIVLSAAFVAFAAAAGRADRTEARARKRRDAPGPETGQEARRRIATRRGRAAQGTRGPQHRAGHTPADPPAPVIAAVSLD